MLSVSDLNQPSGEKRTDSAQVVRSSLLLRSLYVFLLQLEDIGGLAEEDQRYHHGR